jgi:YHS domain-containing protein
MILKLLLAAGLIFITIKLFRKPVENKNDESASSSEAVDLVKDPICGTFVEETTDYKVKYYDKLYYFCSQECRDKFIESKKNNKEG